MTYNTYAPGTVVTGAGWKARLTKAKTKIDKTRDPTTLLVRRIRSHSANIDGAEKLAREEYTAEHASVASPIPPSVHPEVRDLLLRLMGEHGLVDRVLTDPLIETGEPLDARISRYRAAAEVEHQKALADLSAIERENVKAKLLAAQNELARLDVRDSGDPADGTEAIEESVVTLAEPVKRGRGRPPRVSLDRDADDDALPLIR